MIYYKKFGNKGLEIELKKSAQLYRWFDVACSWTRLSDHAGFFLYFSILRYSLEFNFYDGRHWDEAEEEFEEISKTDC